MIKSQIINGLNVITLNGIIKIDTQLSAITNLKSKKTETLTFNEEDKLWYYQGYKTKSRLIDILYPDEKIIKVEFKNNDVNDYRQNNLILTKDERFKDEFPTPENITIVNHGTSIQIKEGKFASQYRNMYWEVKSKKNYIIMHIKNDIYTKISKEDINKILDINGLRPVWYRMDSGYIATTIRLNEEKQKIYYLHQLILDQHTIDNTDLKNTVDHINQDKLDNRRENLRIVNMSEQNKNKGKQTRRKDAKIELPDNIKELPKYVEYRKEIYDKDNNKEREFFIVSHPKLDKIWETTKSNKVSISDKLKYAKAKLDLINKNITEEQFRIITKQDDKIDLPVGIRLELFRGKYHYVLDFRKDEKRYNNKMILHSTDLQKELDKFVELVNVKYPNYMKKYKIENLIEIDENLISTVEEIEENEPKPTYPQNVTVYDEKGSKYIQYNRSEKGNRYNKKMKITSNDIQKELDKLVDEVNKKYEGFNLGKQTVINPQYFKLD